MPQIECAHPRVIEEHTSIYVTLKEHENMRNWGLF